MYLLQLRVGGRLRCSGPLRLRSPLWLWPLAGSAAATAACLRVPGSATARFGEANLNLGTPTINRSINKLSYSVQVSIHFNFKIDSCVTPVPILNLNVLSVFPDCLFKKVF
eukprot:SAG31_NODE_6960_length_1833_cov_2.675317_1_plen_111_part_00